MRCFRWRTEDKCGDEQKLKCSLRPRDNLERKIQINSLSTEAHLISPGFNRRNPGYWNRNFCLYNISLDCPANQVKITRNLATTSLSDGETCRDYLSFHIDSQEFAIIPRLCGAAIADNLSYQLPIPSSSFYAVLFSDDNGQESGRFSLTAQCDSSPQLSSGSGMQPSNVNYI